MIIEFQKIKCCCPTILQCCQKEMTVTKITQSKRKLIGFIQEPILGGFFIKFDLLL